MTMQSQDVPTTEKPHFATLLVMALGPEEVGKRIRAARLEKKWTHEQLLEQVREHIEPRTNLRTVQRWQTGRDPKSGKSWLPRLGTLMDLADLLEKPRSYFVEDGDSVVTPTEAEKLHGAIGEMRAALLEELRSLRQEVVGRASSRGRSETPRSRPG